MTFQFKFLHRIIPTNTYLYKVNIKDNERCSFCKNEPKSLEHLFFDCPIAHSAPQPVITLAPDTVFIVVPQDVSSYIFSS